MSLDPELEAAIEVVVKEMGQSEAVSSRLISWLMDLSEREPSSSDTDQFLHQLHAAIKLHDED
jgi:hypothetical protein